MKTSRLFQQIGSSSTTKDQLWLWRHLGLDQAGRIILMRLKALHGNTSSSLYTFDTKFFETFETLVQMLSSNMRQGLRMKRLTSLETYSEMLSHGVKV